MTVFPPVIKWPGSKRSLAPVIEKLWHSLSLTPTARYFEPFVGGGAMLPIRPSSVGVAGDAVSELVDLWRSIRDQPQTLLRHYEALWHERQTAGHTVFYHARERFNTQRNPADLLFLSRQCVNGLIRFNSRGDFNNSLHHTRPGIHPVRLGSVLRLWSEAVRGVDFVHGDYRQTLRGANPGDVVFCDPPYGGTRGQYVPQKFDFESLFRELERLNEMRVHWVLTLDGRAGAREYVTEVARVPERLYKARIVARSGQSPFRRLMTSSSDLVEETVYANFAFPS